MIDKTYLFICVILQYTLFYNSIFKSEIEYHVHYIMLNYLIQKYISFCQKTWKKAKIFTAQLVLSLILT